ncbi:MAG: 3-deoxy-manno-octulosonate cytidylyltransferase [Gammaproteobacteria bacterium]|nr:3-deoxy-manno-octulosonate cytidylyltransferase [Gammaproteobacteria bacterium]
MSGFVVVIPARYASTRLPGKPLRLLAGRPMIAHVYERALESGADEVIIATDDDRIMQAAQSLGADCQLTAPDHPSGTDRIAEVIDARGYADDRIIVNLQGDEPCMPGVLVRQVADDLAGLPDVGVATLCERIETAAELFDPHVVKVVTDATGFALYFSRAVIPWDREAFAVTTEDLPAAVEHFRHIGLYAYRAGFVREYVRWAPSPIERMEVLEQLRVLWNGYRIHVARALTHPGHGVDTEQDLDRVAAQVLSQET